MRLLALVLCVMTSHALRLPDLSTRSRLVTDATGVRAINRLQFVAGAAAAAAALASPALAEEECPYPPSVCLARASQVAANAKNELRKERLAQCEREKEDQAKNNGELPASVKPATDNPNIPATCVGAPTYQLVRGDPSLPRIY